MSETDIKVIQDTIHDYAGLNLTDQQVVEFYNGNPRFKHEYSEWGLPDTETTTVLLNCLCKHLLNQPWPNNGSDVDREKFFKDLFDAAKQQGYNIAEQRS